MIFRIYNQLEGKFNEDMEITDLSKFAIFLETMVWKDYYEVFIIEEGNAKFYVNNREDWNKLVEKFNHFK